MLTLFCLLFLLKGAKGGEAVLKVIFMGFCLIVDILLILGTVAIGSGIHWLFS